MVLRIQFPMESNLSFLPEEALQGRACLCQRSGLWFWFVCLLLESVSSFKEIRSMLCVNCGSAEGWTSFPCWGLCNAANTGGNNLQVILSRKCCVMKQWFGVFCSMSSLQAKKYFKYEVFKVFSLWLWEVYEFSRK